MPSDLFDQLAEAEVPAPPPEFDSCVHERLNKSLLATQLLDLALHGTLYALGHFAQAWMHLLMTTMGVTTKPK